MNKRMNISIAINEAYIPYAYVMLTSLFENNKDRNIYVYIMYGTISDEALSVFEKIEKNYGQNIICMQVPQDIFPDYLPRTNEWTLEVYYRLLLQDMMPDEVDKILQMDVDMIVNGSLSGLYDIPFNGKSLIVCQDMSVTKSGLLPQQEKLFADAIATNEFKYFNAGIMVMNLAKLRQTVNFNTFLEIVAEKRNMLFAQDQDLLNYLFFQDVIYADENKYDVFAKIAYNNGCGYDWVKSNVSVIHYAGKKPWTQDACRYDTEKIWWEYAKLTPYYYELMEQTLLGEMTESFADKTIIRLCQEKDKIYNLLMKVQALLPKV